MTFQPLPTITDDTAPFWDGGAVGELRINRCRKCRTWFHPPAPVCPDCLSMDVGPEVASGKATVAAFTINVQPWAPDMEVPYVLAIVELDEQRDVRLMTRMVDCAPDQIAVGMPVEVTFQAVDDIWLPLFRPAVTSSPKES
ncbi:MAG: OB-fold domain-containing protein [Actinomycetota bacterium]|nr:OB-fold domain-containing protein [Actinomycetota bacterium]